MTYSSKVDWWLAALVIGGLAVGPVTVLFLEPGSGALPVMLASSGAVLVVIGLLAWPIRYTITEAELKVRSGLFMRWTIPFETIHEVYPTRNPLSSPAWSLDRLRIVRSGGQVLMISPENQEQFLQELGLRARLTRIGDRLFQENTVFGRQ